MRLASGFYLPKGGLLSSFTSYLVTGSLITKHIETDKYSS